MQVALVYDSRMCKPVNKARIAVVCYDFRYNVYPIWIGIMQVHNQVKRQTLVVWCKIRLDETQACLGNKRRLVARLL